MFNLILSVMAIGLTAALLTMGARHLPTWIPAYHATMELLPVSLCHLEDAIQREVTRRRRVPNPIPHGATFGKKPYAEKDGGLSGYFARQYQYLPAAPMGGAWSYGVAEHNGNRVAYVCLQATTGFSEGTTRGLLAFKDRMPTGQWVVGQACGDALPAPMPETYPAPLSATFYIKPGVSSVPGCHRRY